MKHITHFLLAVILLTSNIAFADVRLPAIFSDNMMLQQNSNVAIWGRAKPASKIIVQPSWSNKRYSTISDQSGKWKIKINTPPYGGPFTITISDGQPVTISNVLIGEVWICSGQSNMEMPMKGFVNQPVEGSMDAIVRSKNKNIRLFTVKRNAKTTLQDDCQGSWTEAAPELVYEFSAVGYFYGRLLNEITRMPVGLINVSLGGSAVQGWMNPHALEGTDYSIPAKSDSVKSWGSTPTLLFNAMLNPIIGYGMRGAIWYQGESNHKRPENYALLLEKMVIEWRNLWGIGAFPFYYVQIAPYRYNDGVNSALLREAQLKASNTIQNVAIAINMDANSPDCIHPSKKKEVGERLAYLALAKTYQVNGFPYCSPILKEFEIKGYAIELTFETLNGGKLTSFGKEIKGFLIAGKNRYFEKAKADIAGNKITVFSASIKEPVAVRYAFDDDSAPEIFTLAGLPVSSFRTDDWEVK